RWVTATISARSPCHFVIWRVIRPGGEKWTTCSSSACECNMRSPRQDRHPWFLTVFLGIVFWESMRSLLSSISMFKFLHASHGSVSLQRSNGHAGCACEHCVHVRKGGNKTANLHKQRTVPRSYFHFADGLAAGGGRRLEMEGLNQ